MGNSLDIEAGYRASIYRFSSGENVVKYTSMLRVGVLTVSDRGWRRERPDESGLVIKEHMSRLSANVVKYEIVPDEREIISTKLRQWADGKEIDLIITTGGTGLAERDVTPEATLDVVERLVPGLVEAMRLETMKKTPYAVLSRAVSGTRGKCLIINLPGSVKGVRECLQVILSVLPHAVEILKGETHAH